MPLPCLDTYSTARVHQKRVLLADLHANNHSLALQVHIVEGRHPVLDSLRGGMVPNDVHLAASGPRVQIITGPNMGGGHHPASTAFKHCAAALVRLHVSHLCPTGAAQCLEAASNS